MENSTNNNSSKTIRTYDIQSPEESTWTMYFEDFLLQNDKAYSTTSSLISSGYESSLISDASFPVNAKQLVDNCEETVRLSMNYNIDRSCNRLSFKKRKTKQVLLDDALEDTASYPVNSPKVFKSSQSGVKTKEKDDDVNMTNMFENKLGSGISLGQVNERKEEQLGYNGKESDCTEQKKRDLCLVPLSMLVNYLG